jgi:hypothetical protein
MTDNKSNREEKSRNNGLIESVAPAIEFLSASSQPKTSEAGKWQSSSKSKRSLLAKSANLILVKQQSNLFSPNSGYCHKLLFILIQMTC